MKRLYAVASHAPDASGHAILLDGRAALTPLRRKLIVPTAGLAEAIAAEWAAQGPLLSPESMRLTQLAATAIDRLGPDERGAIEATLGQYAQHELLCYRAEHPPALIQLQAATWQPLLDWAHRRYDAALSVTTGLMPAPQPQAALDALWAAVRELDGWTLSAVQAATAATGSLVLALALSEGRVDPESALEAAELDATFQADHWGRDPEAEARRTRLHEDVAAAARFLALLRGAA